MVNGRGERRGSIVGVLGLEWDWDQHNWQYGVLIVELFVEGFDPSSSLTRSIDWVQRFLSFGVEPPLIW